MSDDPSAWFAYWSAENDREYYFNPTTKACQWDLPDEVRVAASPASTRDGTEEEASLESFPRLQSWEVVEEHSVVTLESSTRSTGFGGLLLLINAIIGLLVYMEMISISTAFPTPIAEILIDMGVIRGQQLVSNCSTANNAEVTPERTPLVEMPSERMADAIRNVKFDGESILQRVKAEIHLAGLSLDGPSAVEVFTGPVNPSTCPATGDMSALVTFDEDRVEKDPCKNPLSFLLKPKCRAAKFNADALMENLN